MSRAVLVTVDGGQTHISPEMAAALNVTRHGQVIAKEDYVREFTADYDRRHRDRHALRLSFTGDARKLMAIPGLRRNPLGLAITAGWILMVLGAVAYLTGLVG